MIPVSEKIKHIELLAKRLMKSNMLAHARSVVKGSGLDFDQLRDYQNGDDVRALDWNSSARMNKLLVKQFNDERHRTLFIVLDVSASCFFGSKGDFKEDVMAHVAAIISYAGYLAKDEIGLILFSDIIEAYVPPRKGKAHLQQILEKIFSVQKKERGTNLDVALDQIIKARKKNALVFLISDFIAAGFEKKLSVCAQKCEMIAFRVHDSQELEFPSLGLITMQDSETKQIQVIDSRSQDLKDLLQERISEQSELFSRNRVPVLNISSQDRLIENLIHFFKIRNRQ